MTPKKTISNLEDTLRGQIKVLETANMRLAKRIDSYRVECVPELVKELRLNSLVIAMFAEKIEGFNEND